MGSEMTPGVNEQVNQHGLVVKLINHTGLPNQALSEMGQTRGPEFLQWRATLGASPDVAQRVFEFLVELLPDGLAKT
jgi:hypothetical protein